MGTSLLEEVVATSSIFYSVVNLRMVDMSEEHYLQLISEASIDGDMQLRNGFGKMAESLILLLCPCTSQ